MLALLVALKTRQMLLLTYIYLVTRKNLSKPPIAMRAIKVSCGAKVVVASKELFSLLANKSKQWSAMLEKSKSTKASCFSEISRFKARSLCLLVSCFGSLPACPATEIKLLDIATFKKMQLRLCFLYRRSCRDPNL